MSRSHTEQFEKAVIIAVATNDGFRNYCIDIFKTKYWQHEDYRLLWEHVRKTHKSGHVTWLAIDDSVSRDVTLSDEKVDKLRVIISAISQHTEAECKSYLLSVQSNVEEYVREIQVKRAITDAAKFIKQGKQDHADKILEHYVKTGGRFHDMTEYSFWGDIENIPDEQEFKYTIELGITGKRVIGKDKSRELGGTVNIDQFFPYYGGVTPGSLVLIQGSSNYGKTTLMLNIASYHMLSGLKVLFYSLEMKREYLNHRCYSLLTGLGSAELKAMTKEGLQQRLRAMREEHMGDIIWKPYWSQVLTPGRLDMELSAYRARGKRASVVYIDYLQIMGGGSFQQERRLQIGEIVLDLIRIAREYGVVIIVNTQSNRQALKEGSSGHTIGEDYSQYQKADLVLAMNREVGLVTKKAEHSKGKVVVEEFGYYLTVDKNRFGKAGVTLFLDEADLDVGRFFDVRKNAEVM